MGKIIELVAFSFLFFEVSTLDKWKNLESTYDGLGWPKTQNIRSLISPIKGLGWLSDSSETNTTTTVKVIIKSDESTLDENYYVSSELSDESEKSEASKQEEILKSPLNDYKSEQKRFKWSKAYYIISKSYKKTKKSILYDSSKRNSKRKNPLKDELLKTKILKKINSERERSKGLKRHESLKSEDSQSSEESSQSISKDFADDKLEDKSSFKHTDQENIIGFSVTKQTAHKKKQSDTVKTFIKSFESMLNEGGSDISESSDKSGITSLLKNKNSEREHFKASITHDSVENAEAKSSKKSEESSSNKSNKEQWKEKQFLKHKNNENTFSEDSRSSRSDESVDSKEKGPLKHKYEVNIVGLSVKSNETVGKKQSDKVNKELIKSFESISYEDDSDTSDLSNDFRKTNSLKKDELLKYLIEKCPETGRSKGSKAINCSESYSSEHSQDSSSNESSKDNSKEKTSVKSKIKENIILFSDKSNVATHKKPVDIVELYRSMESSSREVEDDSDTSESSDDSENLEVFKEKDLRRPLEYQKSGKELQKASEGHHSAESRDSKSDSSNSEDTYESNSGPSGVNLKKNTPVMNKYIENILGQSNRSNGTSQREEQKNCTVTVTESTVITEEKSKEYTAMEQISNNKFTSERNKLMSTEEKPHEPKSKTIDKRLTESAENKNYKEIVTVNSKEYLVNYSSKQGDVSVNLEKYLNSSKENDSDKWHEEQTKEEVPPEVFLIEQETSDNMSKVPFHDSEIIIAKLDVNKLEEVTLSDNIEPQEIKKISQIENQFDCSNAETEEVFSEESNEDVPEEEIPRVLRQIHKIRENIHKNVLEHSELVDYIIQSAVESLNAEIEELHQYVFYLNQDSDVSIEKLKCATITVQKRDFISEFTKCKVQQRSVRFITSQEKIHEKEAKEFNQELRRCQINRNDLYRKQCLREVLTRTKIKLFKIKKAVEMFLEMDRSNRQKCVESVFAKWDNEMYKLFNKIDICIDEFIKIR